MAKILSARNDIASQVGGEVIRGLRFDGSGDPMFKAEDTLSSGYTDKTTLTNWDLYGAQVDGLKYRDCRNIMTTDFVGSWATLSDADKRTLIRHCIYDSTETTENLDLLYTQAERDAYRDDVMETFNSDTANLFSVWKDTDGTYYHVAMVAGVTTKTEITTDEVF